MPTKRQYVLEFDGLHCTNGKAFKRLATVAADYGVVIQNNLGWKKWGVLVKTLNTTFFRPGTFKLHVFRSPKGRSNTAFIAFLKKHKLHQPRRKNVATPQHAVARREVAGRR